MVKSSCIGHGLIKRMCLWKGPTDPQGTKLLLLIDGDAIYSDRGGLKGKHLLLNIVSLI